MLAKCISTKCERYGSCLRSTVEPNHEVNYLAYCGEGDERWYMPAVQDVAKVDLGENETSEERTNE